MAAPAPDAMPADSCGTILATALCRIGEGSGATREPTRTGQLINASYRVPRFCTVGAGADTVGEKSAGEFLARRPRRIVASFQHDPMRPLPEGLSVGRSLGVATLSGHGLQGKSPWTRRRRQRSYAQPRAAIWFAARASAQLYCFRPGEIIRDGVLLSAEPLPKNHQ